MSIVCCFLFIEPHYFTVKPNKVWTPKQFEWNRDVAETGGTRCPIDYKGDFLVFWERLKIGDG